MVLSQPLVAEAPARLKPALREVLQANRHVHTAADDPVVIRAHRISISRVVVARSLKVHKPALATRLIRRMLQPRHVKNRNPQQRQMRILRCCLLLLHANLPRENLPVRLRQPAIGHRPVHNPVAALAGLHQYSTRKHKRVHRRIHHRASRRAHAHRSRHIIKSPRVRI